MPLIQWIVQNLAVQAQPQPAATVATQNPIATYGIGGGGYYTPVQLDEQDAAWVGRETDPNLRDWEVANELKNTKVGDFKIREQRRKSKIRYKVSRTKEANFAKVLAANPLPGSALGDIGVFGATTVGGYLVTTHTAKRVQNTFWRPFVAGSILAAGWWLTSRYAQAWRPGVTLGCGLATAEQILRHWVPNGPQLLGDVQEDRVVDLDYVDIQD